MPIATKTLPCIYPQWSAPSHIQAFTTTRLGGVSTRTHYTSFNLAMHAADHTEHVLTNRERLVAHIGHPIQWLTQKHTGNAVLIDSYNSNTPADASYTHRAQTVCAVLTADCVPIILTNRKGSFVAAIHAGWKGLAQDIISTTVRACNSDALLAWIGPCISQHAYQVGPEFHERFVQIHPDLAACFCQIHNHWHANLSHISQLLLQQAGVEDITISHICTADPKNQLFSARRDGIRSGRIATCIWIQK